MMNKEMNTDSTKALKDTILRAVAIGIGVSTLVLNILGNIEMRTSVTLLSICVICLSVASLQRK